ncbi:GxxExxY protein [Halonatronum saccharophilum]|uniref:GxxExxY protein n=1 Tax=Halonatronum saccharophilum TaxID=150060 RepID=UPI0004B96D12|nr:GxxExxY protein [Halonatronum saccharophilum]
MIGYLYQELTERIIRSFYNVYDQLGYGFLEHVYENALVIELEEMGLEVERQKKIEVMYKGQEVGLYVADIVVKDKVVVEVKAISKLIKANEMQLLNYLKATGMQVGLVVNFGPRIEFKRKYLDLKGKNQRLDSDKSLIRDDKFSTRA